jgi:lipopolysaccharide transport system permease protein
MIVYGYEPGWQLALFPVFILLAVLIALGIGLFLSALNVRYRDVRYVVPFMLQIWMYASPVAYPASLVHGTYAKVYALNPMTGIIEGFRWSLLGGAHPKVSTLAISLGSGLVLTVLGALYFSRTERSFADVI